VNVPEAIHWAPMSPTGDPALRGVVFVSAQSLRKVFKMENMDKGSE
jgi:hypothetical protein